MSLQDKLKDSTLSLQGNGFDPQRSSPAFGYADASNSLDPKLSKLQYTYDVNSNPNVRVVDFNKTPYKSTLPSESQLDELDTRGPKNLRAGTPGSVVSQVYKSSKGNNYKDLGPTEGRY